MDKDEDETTRSSGYADRVQSAVKLKDYAISNNLDVSDETLRDLSQLASGVQDGGNQEDQYLLDRCIRDITEVTYPTTIETLGRSGGFSGKGSAFMWIIAVVGVGALTVSILTFGKLQDAESTELYTSILAASLGTLGALIYIFFNLIGVLSEKAFSDDDIYTNSLRIVIGAIIGWVFFFAFVPDLGSKAQEGSPMLLLPFLGGFSTRLVVGIMTQAIGAIELTLGLQDKSTDLRRRNVNKSQRGTSTGRSTK